MISELEARALDRAPVVLDSVESSYARRPAIWRGISAEEWSSYAWQWANRLMSVEALDNAVGLNADERRAVEAMASRFGTAISPHFAALFRPELGSHCPIRRQAIPIGAELDTHDDLLDDPLGESRHAIAPCAVRRYPDRALIYATHECAMRCRHCTRRSRVGLMESVSQADLQNALDRVTANPNIRDVLISGGDPLSLENDVLEWLIASLKACPHIDVVRVCTRMVSTLPQRMSDARLIDVLRKYAPIYVNTQFNHPFEATREAAQALAALRSAGCILGNQSVLLKGINDAPAILEPLFRWLLREGCRPYYLFLCDVAQGTHHFRTSIQSGLDIMRSLRGRLSGLAIPHFVIDLPDGNGKVDLCPDSVVSRDGQSLTFHNWFGASVNYRDVE